MGGQARPLHRVERKLVRPVTGTCGEKGCRGGGQVGRGAAHRCAARKVAPASQGCPPAPPRPCRPSLLPARTPDHLHLLACEAALVVEGHVVLAAVQDDLVAARGRSRAHQRLDHAQAQAQAAVGGVHHHILNVPALAAPPNELELHHQSGGGDDGAPVQVCGRAGGGERVRDEMSRRLGVSQGGPPWMDTTIPPRPPSMTTTL